MKAKIKDLESNETWILVAREDHMNVIGASGSLRQSIKLITPWTNSQID